MLDLEFGYYFYRGRALKAFAFSAFLSPLDAFMENLVVETDSNITDLFLFAKIFVINIFSLVLNRSQNDTKGEDYEVNETTQHQRRRPRREENPKQFNPTPYLSHNSHLPKFT